MKSKKSSFTANRCQISVEGFDLDKLLTAFVREGIRVRNLRFAGDMEIVFTVGREDLASVRSIAKSTYKVTVLKSKGYKPLMKSISKRKITVIGIMSAIGLLYFQSLFVAQIDVDGYVKYTEKEMRQVLREAGLYEGCRSDLDIDQIKQKIYEKKPGISWAGIKVTGRYVKVDIAEGSEPLPKAVDAKKPADIVADKAGYIYDVIPRTGMRAVKTDQYVKKGDVLIRGKITLRDTAVGNDGKSKMKYYVHAAGDVRARVPYRYVFYGLAKKQIKKPTGRKIYGISLILGDRELNSAKKMNRYKYSSVKTRTLIDIKKPFPIKIAKVTVKEVDIKKEKILKKDIKKAVYAQIRKISKEKLPQKSQILNKSLNFAQEKNIIKIGITLEVLRNIGKEKEIVFGKHKL